VEVRADGAQAEDQDEEVKRIERPTEKTRDKGIPLHRREPAETLHEAHRDVSL
jgi:hypothetical protein